MKRLKLYTLVFLLTIQAWSQNGLVTKAIEILPDSELSISGDTNINKFRCEFNTFYLEQHREVIYSQKGNTLSFKNAILTLKNEGFDCGNRAINKDFHSLLNTSEYPKITLELMELIFTKENNGHACVKITIAGRQKTYVVPVDITLATTSRFIGKMKLNIGDFGLQPPKKMLGLIVIKEEIDINFDLAVVF